MPPAGRRRPAFHLDVMVLVSLMAAAVSASGGNLLRNAGFESVAADGHVSDWTYVSSDYTSEAASGMNGTRGLVFRARGRSAGTPLLQRVRVTPGIRYHYGAWGKVENLKGDAEACARVCLLWEDNWGRLMSDGSFLGIRLKGTSDWKKIEACSPIMPAGAKWMTIRVEVIGTVDGGTVAYFDDAFLEPVIVSPVGRLFCSAYRETQASGEVTFAACVNSLYGRPELPLTATLTYLGADGRTKTKTVPVDGEKEIRAVVHVEDMAIGEHEVTVEAFLANGGSYGKSAMKFTRTAEEVRRRVSFDHLGRTLVDGRPFLPLGMYWSVSKSYHTFQLPRMNAETLAEYAKGPFNCVMTYVPPTREVMDAADRLGIKVIYPINGYFGDDAKWTPDSKGVKGARAKIVEFRNHPALLAWYLNDERPVSMLENLIGRRELVKKLDPDHPTWSVLYQIEQMCDYMPTCDVMGSDPYPVPDGPIGQAWQWADKTRRDTYGIRPLWQVPQAFDWGTFRQKDADRYRMPTRDEMANMAWQAIAGGANGLVFYSYTYMMRSTKTPFEKAWADARSAASEIRDLQAVILADGRPPKFSASGGKVAVRGWRRDGARYLLVVNTTRDAVSTTVTADEDIGKARALVGAGPSKVEGRTLAFDLAPISQSVVELR